jgi:hypothetical protein
MSACAAWLSLLCATAAAGPPGEPAPAAGEVPSVLVLPLEPKNGTRQDVAELATAILVGRLRAVPGVRIVSYDEVENAMTQEQRRMMAGCESVGCAAEIAGALNVDQIVLGALGRMGKSYVLSLSRIQARSASPLGTAVRRFDGATEDTLVDEIARAAADLFPAAAHLVAPAPAPAPAPLLASPGVPYVIVQHPPEQEDPLSLTRVASLLLRAVGGVGVGGALLLTLGAAAGGIASSALLTYYLAVFYVPATGFLGDQAQAGSQQQGGMFMYYIAMVGSLGILVSLVAGAAATAVAVLNVALFVAGVAVGKM